MTPGWEKWRVLGKIGFLFFSLACVQYRVPNMEHLKPFLNKLILIVDNFCMKKYFFYQHRKIIIPEPISSSFGGVPSQVVLLLRYPFYKVQQNVFIIRIIGIIPFKELFVCILRWCGGCCIQHSSSIVDSRSNQSNLYIPTSYPCQPRKYIRVKYLLNVCLMLGFMGIFYKQNLYI